MTLSPMTLFPSSTRIPTAPQKTRRIPMCMQRLALAAALCSGGIVTLSACPLEVEGSPASPSATFVEIIKAAQAGDQAKFDNHLSKSFHLVITGAEALALKKPELRGAFTSAKFMAAFAQYPPIPRLERAVSGKAFILAANRDGQPDKYEMVVENGVWKLNPPKEMVDQLGHFESLIDAPAATSQPATQAAADPHAVATKPNPKTQALDDALKRADIALRQRDPTGAQNALAEAVAIFPDDMRVHVGQARVLVQQGRVKDALEKFADVQTKFKGHMPAFHYGGMAHIMNQDPASAAKAWAHIQAVDPEYFLTNNLAGRLQVARKAAEKAGTPVPPSTNDAPASQPAP